MYSIETKSGKLLTIKVSVFYIVDELYNYIQAEFIDVGCFQEYYRDHGEVLYLAFRGEPAQIPTEMNMLTVPGYVYLRANKWYTF